MERNLDRWTIFFAIVFVVNTIVLLEDLAPAPPHERDGKRRP